MNFKRIAGKKKGEIKSKIKNLNNGDVKIYTITLTYVGTSRLLSIMLAS